jgi:hypothetical protein
MPPLPPTLAAAITQAEPLLARRERISVMLQDATGRAPALLADVQNLKTALTRTETKTALGESTAAQVEAARTALTAAESAYSATVGRQSALRAELVEQQPALAAAAAEVEREQAAYVAAVRQSFMDEYSAAAAQFGRLVLRGRLIEQTLHVPIDLAPPETLAMPVDVSELGPAARVGDVADSLAAATAHCGLLRQQERRQTGRPEFSATACYYFMLDSIVNGVPYQQGSLVSADSMPLNLLERLYRGKRISMESTRRRVA